MSKTLKRAVLFLLALCLILSVAACSKPAAPETKEPETKPAAETPKQEEPKKEEELKKEEEPKQEEQPEEEDMGLLISKEPVEFTFFYNVSAADDGQWDVLKEAARLTNVNLTVTLAKNANFTEAWNLMLASGELTDFVNSYWPDQVTKFGVEGAFAPINEYLDIMPHFKAFLDANPDARRSMTSYDGNIYYIPLMPDGNASYGWFIRNDWLEKLGLEVPYTKEELYDVFTAFRTQDPNGNGEQDEVPYFSGRRSQGIDFLLPMWNAYPYWYAENGTVKFGPLQPEYKEAMKNIAQWYAEGLIDKEIFTRGGSARADLLGNNLGGSTHEWIGSTAAFNDSLADQVEGLDFEPMAPPEGREPVRRSAAYTYGWSVSTQCKDIETAMKYLDFWFTEEGRRLANFGIEGVHYDLVDGVPVFKEELLADPDFKSNLVAAGAQPEFGFKQDFAYEAQWLNDIAREGQKLYEEHEEWFLPLFPELGSLRTPEEFEQYSALYTPIETYVDETVQQWILGLKDVDETYDAFVAQLQTLNVDEVIAVQQAAYDRYMAG